MSNGILIGSTVFMEDWGTKRRKGRSVTPKEDKKAYMKEYMPAYRESHRPELRRNYRKCMPPLGELVPGYVPLNAAKESPPPACGGDCENCPYDDGCHYPGWDKENEEFYISPSGKRTSREARRRGNKAYDARQKEKRKTDPELDEREKAKNRRYSAKNRAKVKFVKAGGTPARFETLWEKAGGTPERFKALLAGPEGQKTKGR